jgi:putative DNA primase/helicase
VWGPDPDSEDEATAKVLTRAKANLAPAGASASFQIEAREIKAGIEAPYLHRGVDRHISADDLVAGPDVRSAVEDACDFLRTELSEGPRETAKLLTRAIEAGHAEKTIRRAKRRLGVESRQAREDDRIGRWEWYLPHINQMAM